MILEQETIIIILNLLLLSTIELYFCLFCNCLRLEWKNRSIAVVTGSSTGIGFETSLFLARNGFYTYATMRDTRKRQIKSKKLQIMRIFL